MDDKKEGSGMIIFIIIVLVIIIGVIAYMVFANDSTEESNTIVEDTTNDEVTDTVTMEDVAGSYYGVFYDESDSETDTETDTEDDIDVDDDTILDDDEYRFELKLDEDGNARIVRTDVSEDIIDGTYTVSTSGITVVSTDDDSTKTYEFTINDDDSLKYTDGTRTITLDKVDDDMLDYIK